MTEAQKLQDNLGATKTVKLKYPVRLATGETLTELKLRRPRVGDPQPQKQSQSAKRYCNHIKAAQLKLPLAGARREIQKWLKKLP